MEPVRVRTEIAPSGGWRGRFLSQAYGHASQETPHRTWLSKDIAPRPGRFLATAIGGSHDRNGWLTSVTRAELPDDSHVL